MQQILYYDSAIFVHIIRFSSLTSNLYNSQMMVLKNKLDFDKKLSLIYQILILFLSPKLLLNSISNITANLFYYAKLTIFDAYLA